MPLSNKYPYVKDYHWSELPELQPGDHVVVPFQPINKIYYHHGIYIGNKEFIEMNDKNPTIQKISFKKFLKEGIAGIVDYSQTDFQVNPEQTVKRAKEKLQNPGEFSVYNMKSKNCEHFAHYCTTGRYDNVYIQINENMANYLTDINSQKKFSPFSFQVENRIENNTIAATHLGLAILSKLKN